MNNKSAIEPTPIPIETCLTLDDSFRDPIQFNRYWFDLPGEWNTATNNERVIGIRSIFLLHNRRKLEYTIHLRKYLKASYLVAVRQYYSDHEGISINWTTEQYNNLYKTDPFVFEEAIKLIPSDKISDIEIPIVCWLPVEKDLRELYIDFMSISRAFIEEYNSTIIDPTLSPPNPNQFRPVTKPKFFMGSDKRNDRDIQMDGEYINNDLYFAEHIYSPRNNDDDDIYNVDIKFSNMNQDFKDIMNIYNDCQMAYIKDRLTGNKYDPDDDRVPEIPNERRIYLDVYEDELDYDPFNPSSSSDDHSSNYKSHIVRYSRSITLKNIWDRHTCKLYSSLASQANKNYLGHSEVHYNPIKYYILRSTDNRFWIDFYSGRHPKAAIKLPRGESFFIELQLQSARKLLYI